MFLCKQALKHWENLMKVQRERLQKQPAEVKHLMLRGPNTCVCVSCDGHTHVYKLQRPLNTVGAELWIIRADAGWLNLVL